MFSKTKSLKNTILLFEIKDISLRLIIRLWVSLKEKLFFKKFSNLNFPQVRV